MRGDSRRSYYRNLKDPNRKTQYGDFIKLAELLKQKKEMSYKEMAVFLGLKKTRYIRCFINWVSLEYNFTTERRGNTSFGIMYE